MKNVSSDNAIQKRIICELWLLFFSNLGEEIAGVTDCRDNDAGSFSNNDDQWLSSAGIIYHPELQNEPKKVRMRNYKRARTSEIFHFYNFSMETISRYNTIQKAINCELWLIFFPVPWEEIAGVTDCRDNDTGSFPNNDDQGLSSSGFIYHPELQNELKKLGMRNYKRARELLSNSYFLIFLWKMLVAITQFKK